MKKLLKLSFELAKYEFKLRNEGTYLGILWYFLNPLLTFFILLLVFSNNLGQSIENYPLYLLTGILIFRFFNDSTTLASSVIRDNRTFIRSLHFPKEMLVISTIIQNIFSHLFDIAVLTIIFILFGKLSFTIIFYPLILLFLILFAYGISLIISSLVIYIIDIRNIWGFLTWIIWLGTPIFYQIPKNSLIYKINLFNPMFYFIEITREILIYKTLPEIWMITAMGIFSLTFLIIGILTFSKLKNKFAEKL